MKEANEKKKQIIAEAETQHKESIAAGEIRFLKEAYERIQQTVRKIDKEVNEEISKAILESKQALFNRRDEIINSVFENVKKQLVSFRNSDNYKTFLEGRLSAGLEQVGSGDIQVLVDIEDLPIMEQINKSSGFGFTIAESEEQLLGGFLMLNREKGFMCDFSYKTRLAEERSAFLENYGISID